MSNNGERILIGKVIGLFGVKGWVKVHSHTEPKANILTYQQLQIKTRVDGKTHWLKTELEDGKPQGKGIIVKFKEISDRTAAEAWLGREIYVDRNQLEALAKDDYYWHDLIGCTVVNLQDVKLGEVQRLLETGSNDVLVLKPGQRLLPYIWQQVIVKVDLHNKTILVDWPEDYFE